MQIENDYDREVYNGDLGVVGSINPETSEMVIAFDGRPVTYGFGELDEVVLAYATTIHKSQGSEYPAVVIVGQKKALAIAVKGKQRRCRWSKLKEWICSAH